MSTEERNPAFQNLGLFTVNHIGFKHEPRLRSVATWGILSIPVLISSIIFFFLWRPYVHMVYVTIVKWKVESTIVHNPLAMIHSIDPGSTATIQVYIQHPEPKYVATSHSRSFPCYHSSCKYKHINIGSGYFSEIEINLALYTSVCTDSFLPCNSFGKALNLLLVN